MRSPGSAWRDPAAVPGDGELQHPLKYGDACEWGQLEWAQPVIDIVLNGSNATVDYQLQQMLRTTARNRATSVSRSSSARTPATWTTPAIAT